MSSPVKAYESQQVTPAPLAYALSLLAVAGLLMQPAGEAPITADAAPVVAAESPAPAPVQLPEAKPEAVAGTPFAEAPVDISKLPQVVLRLDAAGSVTYKDDVITEDDVISDLAGSPVSIIIKAEVGAPVPALVELMRWLKKAGIQHTAVEPVKPGS